MSHVDLSRVFEYYHKYINLAINDDLKAALEKHQTELTSFLKDIPKKKLKVQPHYIIIDK